MNNHIKESVSLQLKENCRAEYQISAYLIGKFDGERFALVDSFSKDIKVIILNHKEAVDWATFIMTVESLVKEIVWKSDMLKIGWGEAQ